MATRTSRGLDLETAELTDPGQDPGKQLNEDSLASTDTDAGFLAVVCDGMGGHVDGKRASETAVHTILREVSRAPPGASEAALLAYAVKKAAAEVHALGGDAPTDMRPGCTCVAVLIHERGAEVAHVGDSRVYLLHLGQLIQLTRDHSMVQQLQDAGTLSAEEAKAHPEAGRITRALGMLPSVDVEVRHNPIPVQSSDTLVLCSDGLSDMVDNSQMHDILHAALPIGVGVAAQQLVEAANANGGYDNITVQLVHIQRGIEGFEGSATRDTMVTMPDGSASATPTLIDPELSNRLYPERTTEVSDAPRPRFPSDSRDDFPSDPNRGRKLVLIASICAAVIVGAVALWWLTSGSAEEEAPIPPPDEQESPAEQKPQPGP